MVFLIKNLDQNIDKIRYFWKRLKKIVVGSQH